MNREQYLAKIEQLRKSASSKVTHHQSYADNLSPEDINTLGQELSIHQIELEMQVDEFIRVQEELTKTKRDFMDLLSMLPVAYCVLQHDGVIRIANNMARSMLRNEGLAGGHTKLEHMVHPDDRALYLHLMKLATKKPNETHYRRMSMSYAKDEWAATLVMSYQKDKECFYVVILSNEMVDTAE